MTDIALKQDVQVFEFLALFVPDADSTESAEIIVPLETVLTTNIETAKIKAARLIPSEYDDKLENVVLVVRPF